MGVKMPYHFSLQHLPALIKEKVDYLVVIESPVFQIPGRT